MAIVATLATHGNLLQAEYNALQKRMSVQLELAIVTAQLGQHGLRLASAHEPGHYVRVTTSGEHQRCLRRFHTAWYWTAPIEQPKGEIPS